MNRKALFVLVWLGLFAGTVGVRAIFANDKGQRVPDAEQERIKLRSELESKPRKTAPSGNALTANSQSDAFGSDLSAFVRGHKDGLHRCKELVMVRSSRPTEYLELSFVPRAVSFDGHRHIVQLLDVVVERATIRLTPNDEKCIVEAFAALEPEVDIVPSSRVTYQLCFQNGKQQSS